MTEFIAPVDLAKAYRLINHGPTVLVSASFGGTDNVMAAAWACAIDLSPPKVMVILDRSTKTRELVEASGTFALQVPTAAQVALTNAVGTRSLASDPSKLRDAGVELFRPEGSTAPLVGGCSAWLACKVIPEPHNQETYDLFLGEVVAAWADTRVFRGGRWHFEDAEPSFRSIHHVAGGQFYAIGEALRARD